jgi:oxygen-independent coproporphyrinogen-3 oxidase
MTIPPLSLYVHLPWCLRKCPYCDFNSHELRGPLPEREYVAALLADLDAALPQVQGRRLESVFIGGGTPSLFSAAAIAQLLAGVGARIGIAAAAEVTLEANPGAVDVAHFAGYREAGVNRLSLGVQSFAPAALRALGRVHDAAQAAAAAEAAIACFPEVNLDLMYALPGQDAAGAAADSARAAASGAKHLSLYQLGIEPNTVFFRQPPVLPDDDTAAAIEAAAHDALGQAGYRRYEVSAWARPGHECRHNLNYWRFGDYLGIGAGAHAKITTAGGIVREARTRAPADYLRRAAGGDAIAGRRTVAGREAVFEFMLNALRLTQGFPEKLFSERTGQSLGAAEPALSQAIDRGLLERSRGEIRPTALGLRFLNDLTAMFLPA